MSYELEKKKCNEDLLRELDEISRQIERDQQKYRQNQLQLENQFYSNNQPAAQHTQNRIDLADQIMNELLHNKHVSSHNQNIEFQNHQSTKQKIIDRPVRLQNNFFNQKQVGRAKLQRPYSQENLPLKNSNSDQKPKFSHSPMVPSKAGKSIERKKEEREKNVFVLDEEKSKGKRMEEEKRYREVLQEQVEEKRKQKQKQKLQLQKMIQKEERQAEEYLKSEKGTPNQSQRRNSPKIIKKRDPNGKYSELNQTLESKAHENSLHFMKIQLEDINFKLKKGRISHEEYDREKKKIYKFYGLVEPQEISLPSWSLPSKEQQPEEQKKMMKEVQESKILHSKESDQRNKKQNKSLFAEEQKKNISFKNNSNNSTQNKSYENGGNELQMQMMLKLFEEMKEIRQMYKTNIHDKRLMEETLSKLSQFMNFPQTHPIPPQKSYKQDYYQDEESYESKQMESHVNLSLLDKSLVGMSKKIPLTQKHKENEFQQQELKSFYSKSYRVKKYKCFDYIESGNPAKNELRSKSSYLSVIGAKQRIKKEFENDLNSFRKMQKERQLEKIKQIKMNKISSKDTSNEMEKNFNQYQNGSKSPFLKKPNSNEFQNSPIKSVQKQAVCFPHFQSTSEVLQQSQYQTEQKKQGTNYHLKKQEEMKKQEENHHSQKIEKIIKFNNELLCKYDNVGRNISDTSIKESLKIEESKECERKQYSSPSLTSPIKNVSESSLKTIKSQQQSLSLEQQGFEHIKQFQKGKEVEKNFKKSPLLGKNTSLENQLVGVSQTVQSIDESSPQLMSFQKPPVKKTKSVNRKKESVVKISASSMGRSAFSSEKNSLLLPPSYHDEKNEDFQSSKYNFSSLSCQSGYDESSAKEETKVKKFCLEEGQIFSEEKEYKQKYDPKFKSLQQARKIAKQCKQKCKEQESKSSIEEKLSELEEFILMTKKDDSQISYPEQREQKEGKKKKNILAMLDELGSDEYEEELRGNLLQSQK